MTESREQLVGQLQRPGQRPENVKLILGGPAPLIQAIADQDATPSVVGHNLFTTANTVATTITDFDDGRVGQIIDVIIGDANTTIDFTGTNLTSDNGTDWSPSNGDHMRCIYDGSTWYCAPWDVSAAGGANELNDLTDVTITSSTTGDLLRHNGTTYVDYSDSNYAAAVHTHTESDITDLGNYGDITQTVAVTGTWTLDGTVTTSDFGTGGRVKDGLDTERPVGFNSMPIYEIDVSDTFDLAHNGMIWHKDSGGAVTFTCDNDSTIPQGATYVVHNDDTEDITIAQGSGVTIALLAAGGPPVTGNILIEQGGIATVYKYSDTEFWVWGSVGASTVITNLDDLNDVDLTGAANNDLLFRSGGNWIDTAGALTWDGSNFSATNIGNIAEANLVDKSATETITGTWTLDGPVTTADYGTGGRVKDGLDASRPVGFNSMPVYEIDASDTFDLAHNGMIWHKDAGGAVTFTCANDANIPQGATYVVHNDDTEDITIAEGSGVTISLLAAGGAPTTGNVTLEQGGIVTVYKYSDTEFWVWGSAFASSVVSNLDDLSDVNLAGAANNDLLFRSAGNWVDTAGSLTWDGSNLSATNFGNIAEANLVDKSATEAITGTWTLDGPVTTSDFGTGGRVKDGLDASQPVGFNLMPLYEIDANDAFDLAHNGMLWHKDSGAAVTFTCDNDSNIPVGATYVVANEDTEDLTIAQGTGVTLRWFDGGGAAPSTGNRTLAEAGICTVYKYTDTEFWVWGNGLS